MLDGGVTGIDSNSNMTGKPTESIAALSTGSNKSNYIRALYHNPHRALSQLSLLSTYVIHWKFIRVLPHLDDEDVLEEVVEEGQILMQSVEDQQQVNKELNLEWKTCNPEVFFRVFVVIRRSTPYWLLNLKRTTRNPFLSSWNVIVTFPQ